MCFRFLVSLHLFTEIKITSFYVHIRCSFAVGLAYHARQTIKAHEISGSALDPSAVVTSNVLTVKELLAPLAREQVKLVRCLGLNYSDHAVRGPNFGFISGFSDACFPFRFFVLI